MSVNEDASPEDYMTEPRTGCDICRAGGDPLSGNHPNAGACLDALRARLAEKEALITEMVVNGKQISYAFQHTKERLREVEFRERTAVGALNEIRRRTNQIWILGIHDDYLHALKKGTGNAEHEKP